MGRPALGPMRIAGPPDIGRPVFYGDHGHEEQHRGQRRRAVPDGGHPMREYGHRTFMAGLIGIVVQPVMRLRAGGEHAEHQD